MGQGPFDPGSFNFEGPLVHGPLGLGPFGFGPLVQGPLALYQHYNVSSQWAPGQGCGWEPCRDLRITKGSN